MKHLDLLGKKVVDKVTGFKGVVSSVSFDLYGCVQAIITPPVDKTGLPQEGQWVDITRLEVRSVNPVIPVPNFESGYVSEGKKGASKKSLPRRI